MLEMIAIGAFMQIKTRANFMCLEEDKSVSDNLLNSFCCLLSQCYYDCDERCKHGPPANITTTYGTTINILCAHISKFFYCTIHDATKDRFNVRFSKCYWTAAHISLSQYNQWHMIQTADIQQYLERCCPLQQNT